MCVGVFGGEGKNYHDVMTEDNFPGGQKLQRKYTLSNALNVANFVVIKVAKQWT